MTVYKCDRCRKECTRFTRSVIYIESEHEKYSKDLCPSCYEAFKIWIEKEKQ